MNIEELPVETLMHILSFLPSYGQVSLVNKNFYNIVCSIDSSICLRIDRRFVEKFFCNNAASSQWLQSILTSNRKVSTVEIQGQQNDFLPKNQRHIIPILEKFSSTIKCMKICCASTDKPTFLKMLSLTPNVERLYLYGLDLNIDNQMPEKEHCDYDFNFNKLKLLVIRGCDDEFDEIVISRIPVGILTELQMFSNWNAASAALIKQFNIKKLVLRPMDSTLFDEQVMDVIASLLQLEELAINVTNVPVDSIKKIWKLNKLRNLFLQNNEDDGRDVLGTLIRSNNTSINTLSLKWQPDIPSNLIDSLAKSAPNLKCFNVVPPPRIPIAGSRQPDLELVQIMHHFNFVEVFSIMIRSSSLVQPYTRFNPKLRELTVHVSYLNLLKKWLPTLILAYPNLKKLTVDILMDYRGALRIKPILNGFTAIESLKIISMDPLRVKHLDLLSDPKHNIKFVSIGCVAKSLLTDDLVNEFRAHFDVVRIGIDGTLNMAADRYTMRKELGHFV